MKSGVVLVDILDGSHLTCPDWCLGPGLDLTESPTTVCSHCYCIDTTLALHLRANISMGKMASIYTGEFVPSTMCSA